MFAEVRAATGSAFAARASSYGGVVRLCSTCHIISTLQAKLHCAFFCMRPYAEPSPDDLNTISSIASVSVYIRVLRVLAQENICRCIFSNHGSGALGWATLMGNCCVRRQSEIRVVVTELEKTREGPIAVGHLGHYLRDLPLSQRTRNELKRIHRD